MFFVVEDFFQVIHQNGMLSGKFYLFYVCDLQIIYLKPTKQIVLTALRIEMSLAFLSFSPSTILIPVSFLAFLGFHG